MEVNKESRTVKSIRNTSIAFIGQIISVFLGFFNRTIFINVLGYKYVGINGLFSNILSLLSIAEMGFGTAITYTMYKPIAENDEEKISALLNLFRKVYYAIGTFVGVVGLILIPFLHMVVGDISQLPQDLPPIEFIYILYLSNTVLSYFFSYKRSIIMASQNGFIDSMNFLFFTILRNVLQVLVLFTTHSFIYYLIIQIASTILENINIARIADKKFKTIIGNKKAKLPQSDINDIKKNVFAMASYKLGYAIVTGTDNILITNLVSLFVNGLYSNYVLIASTVQELYRQIIQPITSSIGNLVATGSTEDSYNVFKKIMFINGFLAIFCTVCLMNLINPFIQILWKKESLLPSIFVYLYTFNFFITCNRECCRIYIDSVGLFWYVRWKTVAEAALNLFFSIVLAKYCNLGIYGIVLGTIISNLFTNFWWEPYVVYSKVFNKSIFNYYKEYAKIFGVLVLCAVLTVWATSFINVSLIGFILKGIVTVGISLIVFVSFNFRSSEFAYFKELFCSILNKLFSRG